MGVHDAPSARVEVQPEPGAPLAMVPDASHGAGGAIIVLNTTEDDVNEVNVSPVMVE